MKESSYLEGQDHMIRRIKVLPIFRQYSNEKLADLLRLSKIQQYDPNEIVIEQGTEEKSIYFMISGSVKIEKDGNLITKLQKNGDVFGELGFLDEGPRSSTVRAIKDTTCLAVDVAYLLRLQEEGHDSFHAAIYKMIAQILAFRLRDTTIKYTNLRLGAVYVFLQRLMQGKEYNRIKGI